MYSFWKTVAFIIANLVFMYIMLMVTKFKTNIKYIHLSIWVGVIVYTLIVSYFLSSKTESFFFEVSPKRKACLEKQVSLSQDSSDCVGCCGKGTKGGIPSRYNEYGLLLGNDPDIVEQENIMNDNWIRNDLFNTCD